MNTESPRAAFVADVADSLRAYSKGELPAIAMGCLVRFAAAIARQRLAGRLRAAAAHEQTSIEQQSLSVVAGVFEKSGSDSALSMALGDATLTDDASLFAAFQAIVVRAAAQELFQRWGENDALGARLWRGLQRVIRHDARIVAFPSDKPEWAALAELDSLNIEFPPPGHEELSQIVAWMQTRSLCLADVVAGVLAEVAGLPDRRRAVRIDALFAAVRDVMVQSAAAELAANERVAPNPRFRLAAEKALKAALERSQAGVEKYLIARKLDPDMAEAFRKALRDLISDCTDGGPAQAYYEYVRPHAPALSLQDYRKSFRAKFEYLAEGAQVAFADVLREEFLKKSLRGSSGATTSDTEGGDIP
jgi:hypothetical protein